VPTSVGIFFAINVCCDRFKLASYKAFSMTLDIPPPLTSAIRPLDEGMARYLTDTSDTQIRLT